MKPAKFILVLFFITLLGSCSKGDDETTPENSNFYVEGYVQKGQLVKGASITAYALNENLIATGECIPSVTKDDLGSFCISSDVVAPFFEIKAQGYYFVENTGDISDAPIYLSAVVSSAQKTVNVNLLTTITSARIKKLISTSKSFTEAKSQAEQEFLKIFSLQSQNVGVGFELMNISKSGDANAILLAASCLIQEGRNAGEIQNIISEISSEFENTGTLSEKLLNGVFSESKNVSISNVLSNMIHFYEGKDIENFEIPPFYALLDPNYAKGFHVVGAYNVSTSDMYDTDTEGGVKEFCAISYDDFDLECDVDWISAQSSKVCSNIYKLHIDILPNSDVSGRVGHLLVKSKSGEILYTNTTNQRGNGQRLYVELNGNITRSSAFSEGDIVNINGKNYSLLFDSNVGKYYVDVPKSEGGYGISNMPEMVVAGKNGDVLCATFTYKSEIDEFISDISEDTSGTRIGAISSSRASRTSVSDVQSSKIPYYAALKGMEGFELQNPASVNLEIACSLLTLQFNHSGASTIPTFAKLEVELNSDAFLSGEVTTCMYPDQAIFDPSYSTPEIEYNNKSNKLIVRNVDGNEKVSFLIHPQQVSSIKCTAYDESGIQLFQTSTSFNQELRRGANMSLKINLSE